MARKQSLALWVALAIVAASAPSVVCRAVEPFQQVQAITLLGGGDGNGLAIDGNRALIGAPLAENGGVVTGLAYLYEIDASSVWRRSATLAADDGVRRDRFGTAVALYGDTAVVGASNRDDFGRESGAAYVFQNESGGQWDQTAKLQPSDLSEATYFGKEAAINEEGVLISSSDGFSSTTQSSVYNFRESNGGDWIQTDRLRASDGTKKELFGTAIALEGDLAFIGMPWDNDYSAGAAGAGSVRLFRSNSVGDWTEFGKLALDDPRPYEFFGVAVAVDGDTLVVTAPETSYAGDISGSAFVFERNGGGDWVQTARLVPRDLVEGDKFGSAVAISGGTIVVGAPRSDGALRDSGAAYVYQQDPAGEWQVVDKLVPNWERANAFFGLDVAMNERDIFVANRLDTVTIFRKLPEPPAVVLLAVGLCVSWRMFCKSDVFKAG